MRRLASNVIELTNSSGTFESETSHKLRGIVSALVNAASRSRIEASVDDLKRGFRGLVEIIDASEEAVVPHELSSSGLVSALLLCLSPSSCARWCKVVR